MKAVHDKCNKLYGTKMIVLLNSPGIVRGFYFYRSHECPLWVKVDIIELLHGVCFVPGADIRGLRE
jgi:hypothetical protein